MRIHDVAVCPLLNIFAVSGITNMVGSFVVDVYDLDLDALSVGGPLTKRCSLGGPGASAPMNIGFECNSTHGKMAFTDGLSPRPCLLLLSDMEQRSVHVIDVLTQTHVGHVWRPGVFVDTHAVATYASLVAVASNFDIRVFSGGGATWSCVRMVNVKIMFNLPPRSLQFTRDGSKLVAMVDGRDSAPSVLHILQVKDWTFIGSVCAPTSAADFEDFGDAWLVSACDCGLFTVNKNVFANDRTAVVSRFHASSIALFPRGCFVVAGWWRLHVLTSNDAILMAGMSSLRTAWMVAAARAVPRRGSGDALRFCKRR